jgi:predicted pyridoxine 5'-phosphate oxidase superfamily flavin-nucleotide-binding protein
VTSDPLLRSPQSLHSPHPLDPPGPLDPLGLLHHPGPLDPVAPGSTSEHRLQQRYGTTDRAERFYREQVLDHLNARMREFVARRQMAFVATADTRGECDNSFRAGPPGFLHVVDERHLAYPEYRGNGVMASLGKISENAHVGLLLVGFVHELIGLHINGRAAVTEDAVLRATVPGLPLETAPGRRAEHWVLVSVEEAYIHCAKHIPRMIPVPRNRTWGTDDVRRKGGDHFAAKESNLARR